MRRGGGWGGEIRHREDGQIASVLREESHLGIN